MFNKSLYSEGMLVQIIDTDTYYQLTGDRVANRCPLDYFSGQVCEIVKILDGGVKLELLNPDFIKDPKYETEEYCISDYIWSDIYFTPLCPEDKITQDEYNSVLFGD